MTTGKGHGPGSKKIIHHILASGGELENNRLGAAHSFFIPSTFPMTIIYNYKNVIRMSPLYAASCYKITFDHYW